MQAFYSHIPLWPSKEQHSIWLEGGSPLVWSMLYPPSVEEQLQTYTWNGHLDNQTPWTTGQTDSGGSNHHSSHMPHGIFGEAQQTIHMASHMDTKSHYCNLLNKQPALGPTFWTPNSLCSL